MSIDVHELARTCLITIAEQANDLREVLEAQDAAKGLPEAEFEALLEQIDGLIQHHAVIVNIIFPGDEVCPECGGTGQPDSESDGTPKDLPQYEAVLDAIDTWLDNEDDTDGLATTIMELLGAAQAESEAAK